MRLLIQLIPEEFEKISRLLIRLLAEEFENISQD